jgi:hypothetical protein
MRAIMREMSPRQSPSTSFPMAPPIVRSLSRGGSHRAMRRRREIGLDGNKRRCFTHPVILNRFN